MPATSVRDVLSPADRNLLSGIAQSVLSALNDLQRCPADQRLKHYKLLAHNCHRLGESRQAMGLGTSDVSEVLGIPEGVVETIEIGPGLPLPRETVIAIMIGLGSTEGRKQVHEALLEAQGKGMLTSL